jgi:flagellar basal body P-ring formation protein FlgA
MLRWFCIFACAYLLFGAATAFADPVTLRTRVEASGPAITLGDLFQGAGDVSGRAIAPSPPAGQVTTLSVPLLSAAASAAGLDWTPPPGLTEVRVVRPGGARATLPAANGGRTMADAAVRRGETVTLLYEAPGMSLSMRARALEDGAVGQTVSFLNTSSNRTIDAVVTGPNAARATP